MISGFTRNATKFESITMESENFLSVRAGVSSENSLSVTHLEIVGVNRLVFAVSGESRNDDAIVLAVVQ